MSFLALSCGSEDEDAKSTILPLDPSTRHYGGTYSDWAAEWWRWVYETPPAADCAEPSGDVSGALCSLGQADSDSEVFFLTGTFGGSVRRKDCIVPEGKALFFPLVTSSADNAGEPEDSQQTDDQLRTRIDGEFAVMPPNELFLSIDARQIKHLDRYAVQRARYEYTLPESPNIYDCSGAPGITGTFHGFTSGYFVMLPPLSPGEHEIEFGGVVGEGDDTFVTRSIYRPLTIE
jgi:hypothetical protein